MKQNLLLVFKLVNFYLSLTSWAYAWKNEDLDDLYIQVAEMKTISCIGYDLEGANLSYLDLRQANFSHACLKKVQFINTSLSKANFSQSDLREADFTQACVNGAKFKGAYLYQAYFENIFSAQGTFLCDHNVTHYYNCNNVFKTPRSIIPSHRKLDLQKQKSLEIQFQKINRFIKASYKNNYSYIKIMTGQSIYNLNGEVRTLWTLCADNLRKRKFIPFIENFYSINEKEGWKVFLRKKKEKYSHQRIKKLQFNEEEIESFLDEDITWKTPIDSKVSLVKLPDPVPLLSSLKKSRKSKKRSSNFKRNTRYKSKSNRFQESYEPSLYRDIEIDLHPSCTHNPRQTLRKGIFNYQKAYHIDCDLDRDVDGKIYIITDSGERRPGHQYNLQAQVNQWLQESYIQRRIVKYCMSDKGIYTVVLRENKKRTKNKRYI